MTPPDDDDDAQRWRFNLLMAVGFALIVLLGGWLAYAIYQNLQLQKCYEEGRRNCAPIEMPERN
jgi:hypothetical protein